VAWYCSRDSFDVVPIYAPFEKEESAHGDTCAVYGSFVVTSTTDMLSVSLT